MICTPLMLFAVDTKNYEFLPILNVNFCRFHLKSFIKMGKRIQGVWEKYFEPDHDKHPKLCQENRDMFKNCVVNSDCFKTTEDFKKCAQDEINLECIPL